jgi:hypothetical protein
MIDGFTFLAWFLPAATLAVVATAYLASKRPNNAGVGHALPSPIDALATRVDTLEQTLREQEAELASAQRAAIVARSSRTQLRPKHALKRATTGHFHPRHRGV